MTGRRWPALDYAAERAAVETCHAYLQLIGKLPTRARPWCNHGWHLALRVVPRGFRTYPIEMEQGEAEVLFDCLDERIAISTSLGEAAAIKLAGQSVAQLHAELAGELERLGIATRIDGAPNEVEHAVPFAQDHRPRRRDSDAVRRFHRAFSDANRVFGRFRTGFVGKSSPSHLFWGSFDLAVTRFSGREAPLHPGGFPNLPDRVTREAYSHECASAGFWLGGGGVEEAAFYAYGYPAPPGPGEARLSHPAAYWHEALGEFILPYVAVRAAPDPDTCLMAFLEESYAAIAAALGWDRAALEVPPGGYGEPYDVAALRRARQDSKQ